MGVREIRAMDIPDNAPWPAPTFDLPLVDEVQAVRSAFSVEYEYMKWSHLDTGAKCGNEVKTFTRGYAAPEGWEFSAMTQIEEFEGHAWLSFVREDKKYWEITTRCTGNQLAKFRQHVMLRRPVTAA